MNISGYNTVQTQVTGKHTKVEGMKEDGFEMDSTLVEQGTPLSQ